ncbi:two-component system sensor histidine kinase RcsC [Xenorhabdus nematophila]|uniref:two-component system sensor histidine kinase RcsC n=1 Tax=Xenorhabdus nematophila TaxID=628 RepID=UPI000DEB8207|nr:two-component system sensor histidine kinase RcsC [Xenorhabdus nematophila]AYA39837.1 two-component system sensor histidine kinase RcsC [Xenorhabdus nematophila]MBA0018403.1 two-component system sensor histidine kinase RcsC [Xenorhabdus nematophila]MCB4425517.1 two-component system sensor histidine kinase RcsC [Xenorhabdus nematophila]QNJ37480.1 two-component system sensor histidine kinase RcsC [Xenorhabdus nematophila]
MRYLSSFRTSLKISRYLFRVLGFMLWALGALLTSFYLANFFNETKSDIRQEYNANYDLAFTFMRSITNLLRDIQYITEKHLSQRTEKDLAIIPPQYDNNTVSYTSLSTNSDCDLLHNKSHNYLGQLNNLITFWTQNISALYGANEIFFIEAQSMCMVNLSAHSRIIMSDPLRKTLYENARKLIIQKDQAKEQTIFWVMPYSRIDNGNLYVVTPVYANGQIAGVVGFEKSIKLKLFLQKREIPITITILNNTGKIELQYPTQISDNNQPAIKFNIMSSNFGYDENFTSLILTRRLSPSTLHIAYTLPLKYIYDELKIKMINSIILNGISAILIAFFIWLFERKMFAPAEDNAIRLEEHEQFNHKIVASAPVGISILRVSDGVSILSNELAHNYTQMLTYEDQKRIVDIICDKTSSYIDVVTSNNNHLQISFVHSRYRNEEVAICVLIDVSTRVKMEKSLQEMATAAEQANQAKSMFLATVSHELRTPLYGIIGNLELIQSHLLPPESTRLLATMNNSSSLLLKIISDILDFSKIESKQLKIEPKDFSCKEVISHVISNYLPLIAKKALGLYCYIEPNVPNIIRNDPVRLQQIISNLLNNAIKFTASGCVVIEIVSKHGYLYFSIKDTGLGIEDKLQFQLFEPFFQISANKESSPQGTGLGLAICEKLINLMDGDIEFISQKYVGSIFSIRIPLYGVKFHTKKISSQRNQKKILLTIYNDFMEKYLQAFLSQNHFQVTLYNGEEIDGTEILISDQPNNIDIPVHGYIEISEKHIGPPKQIRKNYWLYNTYELSELDNMLDNLLTTDNLISISALSTSSITAKTIQVDHRLNTVKVLVVDDHPINRHLLVDQLNSIGFNTSMANDGIEAIEYIKNNPTDIILTDVNMPNMDGYELTQYLRSKGYAKPIIGITANALAEEKERCTNVGMDSCLPKPVSLAILKNILIEHINIKGKTY